MKRMRKFIWFIPTLVPLTLLLALFLSPDTKRSNLVSHDGKWNLVVAEELYGNSFSTPTYFVQIQPNAWYGRFLANTVYECACETPGGVSIGARWDANDKIFITQNGARGQPKKKLDNFRSIRVFYDDSADSTVIH